MTYKPMEISERIHLGCKVIVWEGDIKTIEQAVLARIAEQGLVIVPKEFLAWMPDGIDDSMPVTLYAQQLNKGGA